MNKKWCIYPTRPTFCLTFVILMIIALMFIIGIIVVKFSQEELILEIILTIILFSIIIVAIVGFFLANISIDENNCLKMPFFCRNLMPAFSEKKKKIVLEKNLVDVHLMHTYVYVYLGFEDENGKVSFINVTMFSKKQQAILQHKLEEYKID